MNQFMLLLLVLVVVNATKFGSAQTKKLDKIKLVHRYLDAWNIGDEETFASLITEDFEGDMGFGAKIGKETMLQTFKSFISAIQDGRYKLNHCKIGKEGEVICQWEGHGKFVKELMGFQPHHKYIHYGGLNVMHFNDQGLITKAIGYQTKGFQEQMLGKTSHREDILQLQEDWWNGKVPSSHLSLTLSKEFSVLTPFGKLSSFAEWDKYIDLFRQASPQMSLDFSCDPSAEDFDVWICEFRSIVPIERANQVGLKVGAKIDVEGVSIIKFDEEGKIEGIENYFDFQDFMRQGTTA